MADQHRAGRRTRRGPAAPYVSAGGLVPGATETSARRVGRRTYERTLVCTPWLAPGTDLGVVLRELVAPHLRPGDVVAISEKVVVVTTGRAIPVSSVTPTRLARMVAHQVRPVGDSRGLSIPEKVQYVIDRIGRARMVAAVVAGALTRPLGIRGPSTWSPVRWRRESTGCGPPTRVSCCRP